MLDNQQDFHPEFVGSKISWILAPVGKSLSNIANAPRNRLTLNLLQQKLVHFPPETSEGFPLPTPQPLPRTLPLLRWLIGLAGLSKKRHLQLRHDTDGVGGALDNFLQDRTEAGCWVWCQSHSSRVGLTPRPVLNISAKLLIDKCGLS